LDSLYFKELNYKYWKKFAFPLIILSLILLSLVFIPQFGYEDGGANRWIKIGNFFSFNLLNLLNYFLLFIYF